MVLGFAALLFATHSVAAEGTSSQRTQSCGREYFFGRLAGGKYWQGFKQLNREVIELAPGVDRWASAPVS